MKILAIETSCDDTSIAIVQASGGLKRPRFKILKNLISSQIKVHAPFGGVVPNLAKREHQKNLPLLLRNIQHLTSSIQLITVTVGPGLEPALWAGIEFAKDLVKKLNKPLIGANHMEGHLYSFLLSQKTSHILHPTSRIFPAIALIVSGGHTILLKMDSLTKWKKLGETRDDAAGEAFDKVARLLGLSYPGGPELEKLAKIGDPKAINFPRPMLRDKNYDFSFSGLKTSVLYYLKDHHFEHPTSNIEQISVVDVAASFQQAMVDVLVGKATRAARQFGARSIFLSGGVAANKLLRKTLQREAKNLGVNFFVPPFKFNTDNAAMIAASAYIRYLHEKKLPIKADASLNL